MRWESVLHLAAFALVALTARPAMAGMWPDEQGVYPNRDYINQQAAENIDPFNGNLHLSYVDGFAAGNGGFDL